MHAQTFEAELAANRAAYQWLRETIRSAPAGQYAAIAHGRLIDVTPTFDAAVAAVEGLDPRPEHFVVFPVEEEPAFDVIDDFRQGL